MDLSTLGSIASGFNTGLGAASGGLQEAEQQRKTQGRQNFLDAIMFRDPTLATQAYNQINQDNPLTQLMAGAIGMKPQKPSPEAQKSIADYIDTLKRQDQQAAEAADWKNAAERMGVTGETAVPMPVAPVSQPAPSAVQAPLTPAGSPPAAIPRTAPQGPGAVSPPIQPPHTDMGVQTTPAGSVAAPAPQNPPHIQAIPPVPPSTGGRGMLSLPGANPGMIAPGNIDLASRPVVKNDDGSISTVKSFSTEIDGKEVLLPLVIKGEVVKPEEAIKHYFMTGGPNGGENLGTFATAEAADAYGKRLHEQQATMYGQPGGPPMPVGEGAATQGGQPAPPATSAQAPTPIGHTGFGLTAGNDQFMAEMANKMARDLGISDYDAAKRNPGQLANDIALMQKKAVTDTAIAPPEIVESLRQKAVLAGDKKLADMLGPNSTITVSDATRINQILTGSVSATTTREGQKTAHEDRLKSLQDQWKRTLATIGAANTRASKQRQVTMRGQNIGAGLKGQALVIARAKPQVTAALGDLTNAHKDALSAKAIYEKALAKDPNSPALEKLKADADDADMIYLRKEARLKRTLDSLEGPSGSSPADAIP